MERFHRHSGKIRCMENPAGPTTYIYGYTSGAKQVVLMPFAIAHAPIMRIYGTFDGVNWREITGLVAPHAGVPIEIPHGGTYKALKIVVPHGSVTFTFASYWI